MTVGAKRECGGCTMCCKLLGVLEIGKPPNVWCPECAIGQGCKVYAERPGTCREFSCMWLHGLGGDSMRPDRCKAVFFQPHDAPLQVHIDPAREWRGTSVERVIQSAVRAGQVVCVKHGERRMQLGPSKHDEAKGDSDV